MKLYCLMLKINDRIGYHSVYTNEGTARRQLLIRQEHADYNTTYLIEEKEIDTRTIRYGTIRFPDSNGALIIDTRATTDESLVQNLLTGKRI